jgi:hypothetical protein
MFVILLQQQVQEGQAEQVGAREGLQQTDVFGIVEPEPEDGNRPKRDTGEKNQAIHDACVNLPKSSLNPPDRWQTNRMLGSGERPAGRREPPISSGASAARA